MVEFASNQSSFQDRLALIRKRDVSSLTCVDCSDLRPIWASLIPLDYNEVNGITPASGGPGVAGGVAAAAATTVGGTKDFDASFDFDATFQQVQQQQQQQQQSQAKRIVWGALCCMACATQHRALGAHVILRVKSTKDDCTFLCCFVFVLIVFALLCFVFPIKKEQFTKIRVCSWCSLRTLLFIFTKNSDAFCLFVCLSNHFFNRKNEIESKSKHKTQNRDRTGNESNGSWWEL